MFVVFPICHKDSGIAAKLLSWAKRLDGKVGYRCLVVHDELCDPTQVIERASEYFAEVKVCKYSHWTGKEHNWPAPQNFQFQQAASYISANKPFGKEPWLWLEPDATPLKPGWLKTIEDRYVEGGKPFMGYVVTGDPYGNGQSISWMTGVGVYPHNMAGKSLRAMTAVNHPWDVVGARDILPQCHSANDIIQHVWERNGEPIHFKDKDDINSVVHKETVLFHRCKDGSLIDALDGPGLVEFIQQTATSLMAKAHLAITEDVSGNVTAVITAHNRVSGLIKAYRSCQVAGFKHIVIAASGISSEMERVLVDCEKQKHTKVLRFGDKNSGMIWAKAVQSVTTELCCILHDDDQYVAGLLAGLSKPISEGRKFIVWPGQIDNPSLGGALNEIGASRGVNSSRLISNHLNHRSRSITPCRGCYPTKIAAAALAEADAQFDSRFYYRDKFLVGNDMLLWLRLSNELPTFYGIDYPGVILGTEDSTTVKDIKGGSSKLMDIYDATREYWDTCPQKRNKGRVVVTGYVPDDSYVGVNRWVENMRKFPPAYEQLYIADHNGQAGKDVKATRVKAHPDKDAKLCGSSIRFVDMVRAAYQVGADYMIVNEPDVRVNVAGWDEQIATEFFDWPHDAVAGGCPVIWNPFAGHAARVDGIMEWGHRYREKSGVLPAYEIANNANYPIIYPNGALGIWDVMEFKLLFPKEFADPNGCYTTLYPYDDKIGRIWWGTYNFRVTKKVAWLTKAYSGCGDRWYNEAQRLHMLTSGQKIAVHQVKNGTL
jgi:hypothetical protein